MTAKGRGLAVFVDGAALAEDEARAFWARFSAHMEEKRGDLEGFARAEGFASVHPEIRDGAPALAVSRTAPQRKYANARDASETVAARPGGSRVVHSGGRASAGAPPAHSKSSRKKR